MNNTNPILICDVSMSPFSVARHYGGAKIYGTTYRYKPERDILVREDWDKVYSRVDWSTFVESVKKGVKPEMPKRQNRKQIITGSTNSLFD